MRTRRESSLPGCCPTHAFLLIHNLRHITCNQARYVFELTGAAAAGFVAAAALSVGIRLFRAWIAAVSSPALVRLDSTAAPPLSSAAAQSSAQLKAMSIADPEPGTSAFATCAIAGSYFSTSGRTTL